MDNSIEKISNWHEQLEDSEENSYVKRIRRQLHMYPEIGFELPKTLELIRSEFDRLGVEYTEQYGQSSIVATVNPHVTSFTIGVRADIDALPVTEQTMFLIDHVLKGRCMRTRCTYRNCPCSA